MHTTGRAAVVLAVSLAAGSAGAQDTTRSPSPRGAPQPLARVKVSAEASAPVSYRLVDFERRRRAGRGQYLASDEIERVRAATLPDLTRGMRGVTLHCGGGGGCRIQMVRAPNGCPPEYVVDGRAENMFGAQTPIRDIVALEVYTGAADVPGEFAGRSAGCGVVVIWTRTGPPEHRRDP